MKKIVIAVPSYNNSKWYDKNLVSIVNQDYDNFRTVYVDDCSPDGTGKLVEDYIAANNLGDRIKLTRNETRKGAMRNLYDIIHSCDDDEIVITLDGDDWFAHAGVLKKINEMYSDPNVWMTYGQYRSWPDNNIGCSKQIARNVIETNSFRRAPWSSSHLRSFYTWLFKKIDEKDFLDADGKFFAMAWDLCMQFPMLEMSGHRAKFISDVLYIYNVANPINDSKVNLKLQQDSERIIRARPAYKRM